MTRKLALVLCSLVAPVFWISPVQGQGDSGKTASEIPFDPSIRTGKLDNGLRYYIQRNAKPEHRAELRLAVSAGSMQEDDDHALPYMHEDDGESERVPYRNIDAIGPA
ncbi:MAG: hypothetical protein R3330_13425, partial [Saprospiraceae bacterium]|nr:hypothetical protein [Saprospiraceae bacterium]